MEYTDITKHDETVLTRLADLEGKCKTGIINHFHAYVKRVSHDAVVIENDKMYVPDDLITDEYISTYLDKSSGMDYSALDCAFLAIGKIGIPPDEEMSPKSLEKEIRRVMVSDYKDKAYGKHVKGKKNVVCVDWDTACEIIASQTVRDYVQSQVKKAEKKGVHKDKIGWRAYELQKEKIARLDALNSSGGESDCYTPFKLPSEQKTRLMAEAVFKMLFTDFDFEKFESYTDEIAMLEDDWDFGKRFQELFDIFSAPDYKGEFYQLRSDSTFLDALAEKIAEKIIEKVGNKPEKQQKK